MYYSVDHTVFNGSRFFDRLAESDPSEYCVEKCRIDLGTQLVGVYSEGQDREKCKKVLKSVIKCDSF
jgi:hypothetical protein